MPNDDHVLAAREELVTRWHFDLLVQASTLVLSLIAVGLARYGLRA
jgi:hypothetical protein